MKKFLIPALSASLLLPAFLSPTFAKAEELYIPSDSGIVYNPDTKEILFEKNADKVISPASLTKVMTLLIVSEEIKKNNTDLNTKVTISEKAWKTQGSLMFLNVDAQVPIKELINGLAIVSGNDAAVALAEYFAGSTENFVDKMNKKAKELGMTNTNFTTVHGLSEGKNGDRSTSRDLMLLTDFYIKNYPENLKIHGKKEYITKAEYHGGSNDISQKTRNPLLGSYEGGTGLKTGMVEDTFNLIGTAERNDIEIIGVVMGAKTSDDRTQSIFSLLDYGFSQYKTVNHGYSKDIIKNLKVYKSKNKKEVDISLKEDINIVVNVKDIENIKVKDNIPKYLEGGFKEGEKIGERVITIDKKEYKYDIVVNEEIKKANFFIRFLDAIAIWFNKLVGIL